MSKNSQTLSAASRVAPGTAPDTSRPAIRPSPNSASSRFSGGFPLKQMPLRIQPKITSAINKKAVTELIKKADTSSNSKGKQMDFSGREAQRDSITAYPTSKTQSDK